MRRAMVSLVGMITALSMFGAMGVAQANPWETVCDNFPGPRDGKARWYHAVCR